MIVMGQVTSGITSAKTVCVVPPGHCTVVLSNGGTKGAYIGTSSAVTHATGFLIPNGSPPVEFTTWTASTGATLWAVSQTTAGVVSFLLATPQ